MIKLLYLSTSDGNAGAFRAAYRIHQGIRSLGIDSKMLVKTKINNDDSVIQIDDIPLNTIDSALKEPYNIAPRPPFSPAASGIDTQFYIERLKPDIIQMHWTNDGFISIESLANIKKKLIWRLPDCWAFTGGCHYFGNCDGYKSSCGRCPSLNSEDENDLSRKIFKRKSDSWANIDLTIVVPTQWMQQCVQQSSLFRNKRIEIIPNGLDIKKFHPLHKIRVRKKLGLDTSKKYILYGACYSTGDPRKGFLVLLEALKYLSHQSVKYEVLIFGANFKPETDDINIPIRYYKYIQDDSILIALYSSVDVMVVPSLQEAFGQTVIEAMACATPVVAFQNTGPAGIIDHKMNGFLAEYNNPIDLAYGINWVLQDEERRQHLSNHAYEKVIKKYDINIVASQYKTLYNNLLNI